MQEMDRSNRRMENNLYNTDEQRRHEYLYDDAWRSEESDGASLQELPISSYNREFTDNGCEGLVSNAIAEVSKDYLSGPKAKNYVIESDESRLSSDSEFKLITGFASYARYPENGTGLSDTDWNPYGTESDTNVSPHLLDNSNKLTDCKTISFNPPFNSTDLNMVTPMTAAGNNFSSSRFSGITDTGMTVVALKPDETQDFSSISHISETSSPIKIRPDSAQIPRADLNQTLRAKSLTNMPMISHLHSLNSEVQNRKYDNLQYIPVNEREKLVNHPQEQFPNAMNNDVREIVNDTVDKDLLGRKVEKVLSETEHLEKDSNSHKASTVDYDMLRRDLQDIQDSLHRTSGEESIPCKDSGPRLDFRERKNSISSEEIIPSTTTTPRDKMAWDFAAVLGYANPGDLMGEISLDTYNSNSQKPSTRPSTEKYSYNSDGDEAHTSDNSSKLDDHAAADQALADMSEILQHPCHMLQSSRDVDTVLNNFRDQRKQIETRYEEINHQRLNNQNLSEKVYRILTNQDPKSRANEILSDISAEEKDMKTRFALGLRKDDFNFSVNPEDSLQIGLTDDVRRRLDWSGLSFDSGGAASFLEPKGFTAFEDMAKFLTSQNQKIIEKTFNHSIEMRPPSQTIQCYPVFGDQDGASGGRRTDYQSTAEANDPQDVESHKRQNNEVKLNDQETELKDPYSELDLGNSNTSPNDSNKEKLRPYRPASSKEVYYIESDTASVTDSVTTIESTHIGSDDARGPNLPQSVLGSRKDAPNVAGIYGLKKNISTLQDNPELMPIQEKSGVDDHERDSSSSKDSKVDATASISTRSKIQLEPVKSNEEISINVCCERKDQNTGQISPVEKARRNARWENHEKERQNKFETGQDQSETVLKEVIPAQFQDSDSEFKYIGLQQPYSLPSDAFVTSKDYTQQETVDQISEPLKLRIHLRYDDTNKSNANDEVSQRWADPIQKSSISEDFLPSTNVGSNVRSQGHSTSGRAASPSRVSPTQQTLNDDCSAIRHARLSPAFRRALSPELRTRIESRSPLLSKELDDCLAQPPSFYPEYRPSVEENFYSSREHRKTPTSPILRSRNRSTSPKSRGRSLSPTFLARDQNTDPFKFEKENFISRTSPLTLRSKSYNDQSETPVLTKENILATERRDNIRTLTEIGRSSRDHMQTKKKIISSPKRFVEMTLEGMSSETEVDTDFDREPISKRALLLKNALQENQDPDIQPDINALWETFKAQNESYESSINSVRKEAVSNLLLNPTHHFVQRYLEERDQYRVERQERAERGREQRIKEQRELQQSRHSSSEDDIGNSYTHSLLKKEEERQKRRLGRKKKGKNGIIEKEKIEESLKGNPNSENVPDNLFAIAEDSFEVSPSKSNFTPSKSKENKSSRQQNVIDPHMKKLRDRIANQRNKIDKNALREIKRMEKLKALENLLSAKQKGEINDESLEQQLDDISSTTQISENSIENINNTGGSDDSTTAKDSSSEMHKWKAAKEARLKEMMLAGKKLTDQNKEFQQKSKTKESEVDLKNSDIKLLKLVSEGYLSAKEAYKLALERATLKEDLLSDEQSFSRGQQNSNKNGRRHKFYSPYEKDSSSNNNAYSIKPKVKQSDSLGSSQKVPKLRFSDLNVDDNNSNSRQSRSMMRPKSVKHSTKFVSPNRHERPVISLQNSRGSSESPIRYKESRHQSGRTQSRSLSGSRDSRAFSLSTYGNIKTSEKNQRSIRVRSVQPSVAWDIPMDKPAREFEEQKESHSQRSRLKKDRKPLKEIILPADVSLENELLQIHPKNSDQDKPNIWHKWERPEGIPWQQWREKVILDALATKTNHYEVDPLMDRVQYILNKPDLEAEAENEDAQDVWREEKNIGEMTLQEAFVARKQAFISKYNERQKRLHLSNENRRMQECLRLERQAIFSEQDRLLAPNLHAHPYSDNLFQPKRRILNKKEMKAITSAKYKKLPEVIEKKEKDKINDQKKINRLRAKVFNKKVQRDALKKLLMSHH